MVVEVVELHKNTLLVHGPHDGASVALLVAVHVARNNDEPGMETEDIEVEQIVFKHHYLKREMMLRQELMAVKFIPDRRIPILVVGFHPVAIEQNLPIWFCIGVIEGGPVGEDHSETEVEHVGLLGQSYPPPDFALTAQGRAGRNGRRDSGRHHPPHSRRCR